MVYYNKLSFNLKKHSIFKSYRVFSQISYDKDHIYEWSNSPSEIDRIDCLVKQAQKNPYIQYICPYLFIYLL